VRRRHQREKTEGEAGHDGGKAQPPRDRQE